MEEMNELVWTNEEWNEMMKKIVEVLNVACDGTDGAGGMHKKVLTDEQIVSFAKKNISRRSGLVVQFVR